MKKRKMLCRHSYCVVAGKSHIVHHQTLLSLEPVSSCKHLMVVMKPGTWTQILSFWPQIYDKCFFELLVMQWQIREKELTNKCWITVAPVCQSWLLGKCWRQRDSSMSQFIWFAVFLCVCVHCMADIAVKAEHLALRFQLTLCTV